MIDKVLFLSKNEFFVVLSKAGISSIVGFEEMSFVDVQDSDVAEAIVSLTGRGLIVNNDEHFEVSEELKKYIEYLASAEYVAVERKMQDTYPISCIYYGKTNAVRTEMDWSRNPRISLRLISLDEFLNEVTEDEILPKIKPEGLQYVDLPHHTHTAGTPGGSARTMKRTKTDYLPPSQSSQEPLCTGACGAYPLSFFFP